MDKDAANKTHETETVEWYKVGRDSAKAPKNISLRKYQMNKKYWAKPEELYMNEVEEVIPKQDNFK